MTIPAWGTYFTGVIPRLVAPGADRSHGLRFGRTEAADAL